MIGCDYATAATRRQRRGQRWALAGLIARETLAAVGLLAVLAAAYLMLVMAQA